MRSGDGWTRCTLGHRHWGRFGAAGLLVVTTDEDPSVLLQHRAPWSHGGDTWGVPGGARDRAETPEQAARRETIEEARLDVTQLTVVHEHVDDHGTWRYTTFVALTARRLPVIAERESIDLRWVLLNQVEDLPLHPAFAAAWPALRLVLP